MTGFRNEVFNQVICISTVEHIGIGIDGGDTDNDSDVKAVKEILRILKRRDSAITTVPHGKINNNLDHMVYDRYMHFLGLLLLIMDFQLQQKGILRL